MRPLLAVVLSLFTCQILFGEGDWEPVYPAGPADIGLLPLYAIASIGGDADSPVFEALIGSRGGQVIWGHRSESDMEITWEIRQLPFDFNVTEVAIYQGKWLVAGEKGQLAVYEGAMLAEANDNLVHVRQDLESSWRFQQIDYGDLTTFEFLQLDAVGERLVGRVDNNDNLYYSNDGGVSWEHSLHPVYDVIAFKGVFYGLSDEYHVTVFPDDDRSSVRIDRNTLMRSTDGIDWEIVWEVDKPSLDFEHELMVLAEAFDENGLPIPGSERLYVSIRYSERWWDENFRLIVSSSDGEAWIDHGSDHQNEDSVEPWNPLMLPEEDRFYPDPGRRRGSFSGNLRVFEDTVEQRTPAGWRTLLQAHPRQPISRDRISAWDTLNFMAADGRFVTVYENGSSTVNPLPRSFDTLYSWNWLVHAYNSWFGEVSLLVPDSLDYLSTRDGRVLVPAETESVILKTDNFEDWYLLPDPSERGGFFLPYGNAFTYAWWVAGNWTNEYMTWLDGNWTDSWIPYTDPRQANRFVFIEEEDSWYMATWQHWPNDGLIIIERIGSPDTEIARFPNTFTPGNEVALTSPDGERLIVFELPGLTSHVLSAGIGVVNTDGSVIQTNLDAFFPDNFARIDAVRFVNGWTYFIGPATVRTRDFETFEAFPSPAPQPIVDIIGFDGDLYVFTREAAYRRPQERGYLDSVLRRRGWRQSDWLGWFLVRDEQTGWINHLLFGESRVTSTGADQYWLNTDALGWIYVYPDWAPLFWHLKDEKWYRLDHDSWPPRAWDYEDRAWKLFGEIDE